MSIVELWTVISNQMIKHQLLHTLFDQILFFENTVLDGFLGLKICSEYVLYLLLAETIPTRFCW